MRINEDEAWIAGYMLGDGYFDKQNKLVFMIQKDKPELLKRIFKSYKLFGDFTKHIFNEKRYNKCFNIQLINKETFLKFMRFCELNETGKKSYTWKIPSKILKSKVILNFLQGLFDAEGYVYNYKYNRQVSIGLVNKEVITNISRILNSYNIKHDIDICNEKCCFAKNITTTYRILIKGLDDITKYSKLIGFSDKGKQKKLIKCINTFLVYDLTKEVELTEMFLSICGEGTEIFKPAIFIRGSKCNFRCKYPCDTIYSYENGKKIMLKDLIKNIQIYPCKTIFLTGGEICLQAASIFELCKWLYSHNYEIILQTNGSFYVPEIFDLCNMISVDFKGPSSGMKSNESFIKNIIKKYSNNTKIQLKFLVKDKKDYIFAKNKIKKYYNKNIEYVIGPVGGLNLKSLVEDYYKKDNFFKNMTNIRIGMQIHKLIWGVKKRGV